MVGICGVGMAGLARLLHAHGCVVSGCDVELNTLADDLRESGVAVAQGHALEHIDYLPDDAVIVVTPAVPADEDELLGARRRGLEIFSRGQVLAALTSVRDSVAICGTHGKTTTSCFTARLFQELGANPDWCIGGCTVTLGTVAGADHNDLLIAEADESDGTLRCYSPVTTVLLNVDIDHLEHFTGESELIACYSMAVRQTRDVVCVNRDDQRAWRIAQDYDGGTLSFGFHAEARLRAIEIDVSGNLSGFKVIYDGCESAPIRIGVGGRHNITNALGAVAAALSRGFDLHAICAALPQACNELPIRRFESIGALDGVRYVADYAHHPTEIRVATGMALDCAALRVVTVFQPHRYTRTRALGADFPEAFAGVDEVVLLPVYAASEQPLRGGCACNLYAAFREHLPQLLLTYTSGLEECAGYLRRSCRSGDLVMLIGAGDVIKLKQMIFTDAASIDGEFYQTLAQLAGESFSQVAQLTGFSVFPTRGTGNAVYVHSTTTLQRVVELCRKFKVKCRPAGLGFNTLISDCGYDGLLVRLAGDEFESVVINGTRVRAGGGVSAARLLDALQGAGLTGLEFMEGIPGTLGGWLAMNAGAHGNQLGDHVKELEMVTFDGRAVSRGADECGFEYRNCRALENAFAVGCTLELQKTDQSEVASARREIRNRRIPLQGLRTAGSVFKNPPGDYAGRLLENSGCKALRVGGAFVTDFHANIVAVDDTGTASDVMALVQIMRERVRFDAKVELQCEIKGVW
jgi:UDP-N-acetylmuramate--alanine ligase